MKAITIILLFATLTTTAQVTTVFSVGATTNKLPAWNIEVGYELERVQVSTGYLIQFTDLSNIPDVFFAKAGYKLPLTEKKTIVAGVGITYHHYSSYNKLLRSIKPLYYLQYETRELKDGSLLASIHYTGGTLFFLAGWKYYFGSKQ